uniref:(northern house mosquito) hypothetical protein n=1 Tax=Culex pipiens TaxID=7175 RepID=A0A8D8A4S0_CULPI
MMMMMVAPTNNNNNVPGSERTATRPASASISPSSYLDQSGGGGEPDITGGGGYNHWKNLENGHSMLYGRRSNSVGNLYSAGQDFYDHYHHHPGLPQVPADKPIGHTAVKSSTERPPTPTSSPRQR